MKTLNDLIKELSETLTHLTKLVEKPTPSVPPTPKVDMGSISILDLKLSVRARNALYKCGIDTVKELFELSYEHLLHIRYMGRVSANEVRTLLARDFCFQIPPHHTRKLTGKFTYNKSKEFTRRDLTHKSEVYKQVCVLSEDLAAKVSWDWTKTQADLAREHGLTRERVRQIRNKLIAAGLLQKNLFKQSHKNASFKP
jgi:hypothetical protein